MSYNCSKFYNNVNVSLLSSIGYSKKFPKTFHVSTSKRYPQAMALKLPVNVVYINSAEVSRFSPTRERDISGPLIHNHFHKNEQFGPVIDITLRSDPHANKYDCHGAVNLSSSMQSNVPSPFSGNHTHLGMPGSQWGQGYKYLSDYLHGSHYLTLRKTCQEKNQLKQGYSFREMSSNVSNSKENPLTLKEKLKQAVKEYGTTVIVFHITISLISLGSCYLLVSSGVDMIALLKYINIGEGTVSRIAGSSAGTFVIAYAVHKCFAPFRIGITLTATPFIVRYFRSIGVLKKM